MNTKEKNDGRRQDDAELALAYDDFRNPVSGVRETDLDECAWLEVADSNMIVCPLCGDRFQHRGAVVREIDPMPRRVIPVNTIDICDYLPPPAAYAFVAAFPPCTHLAVSGARWFCGKGLGRLAESIRLFYKAAQIAEWSGAPYLIENPVSTISSYWRKPDHTFDPCDYGDLYTKKTCLWTGNGFIMPPKNRIEPVEGSKMHLMPPSVSRTNLRSETPRGFSEAVFKANRPSELKSVWLMNHKGEMQG